MDYREKSNHQALNLISYKQHKDIKCLYLSTLIDEILTELSYF